MRKLVNNYIEFGLETSGGLFEDIFEIWILKFWGGIISRNRVIYSDFFSSLSYKLKIQWAPKSKKNSG